MDCNKIWKSINNDEIIIQLYNPDSDQKQVLFVLREAYMKDANTFILFDINKLEYHNARREYEQMVLSILKAGLSLVARHRASNKIIGYCISMIHSRPKLGQLYFYEEFRNKAQFPVIRQLLDFRINKDKQIDLFNLYDTDHYFELVYVAVLSDFRKRNISHDMMLSSVQLARELAAGRHPDTIDPSMIGKIPKIVFASSNSRYSARILEKLRFTVIKIFPFNQLKANGIFVSEKVPSQHTQSSLQILNCVFEDAVTKLFLEKYLMTLPVGWQDIIYNKGTFDVLEIVAINHVDPVKILYCNLVQR
ncbi:uncharacterized protein DMENIID0001_111960 [Sergentomyia squamirostris]